MRRLRAGSIGSMSAWLPSRRSTEHHSGAFVMRWSGQVRSGQLEREERPVLVEGHPLRGHGFRGHQVFLGFSGRDGSRGKEKPPAIGRRSSGRAPRRGARLHKQQEVGGEGPGHVLASSRRVPHRVKAVRVRNRDPTRGPHRAAAGVAGGIAYRARRGCCNQPGAGASRPSPATPDGRPAGARTGRSPAVRRPRLRAESPPARAWVEPSDGVCPTSHPVKAKLSSKIFHLPGIGELRADQPDRCYVDAAAAEADGLRPAKR